MIPFDQRTFQCRCEWGVVGHDALALADVVVIVDVLSFSTCVDIAVSRGVAILPYAWKDSSAIAFAQQHDAELAGPRGEGRYSLSPASFLNASKGVRCVLPSPNGAELTLRAAATRAVVLAGCLRNASAVAEVALRLGATFNVCPAGERWPDGSLRPAVEDWLAAGAILGRLPGAKSPEATAAVAAFERAQPALSGVIAQSSSGRELVARGFDQDVELAAALDASVHVPRYDGSAFVNWRQLAACKRSTNPVLKVGLLPSRLGPEVSSGERPHPATNGGVGTRVGNERRATARVCTAPRLDGVTVRLLEAANPS